MAAYCPMSVPSPMSTVPHDSPQVPFAEQVRYWARQLDGVSAPKLPADRTRSAGPPSTVETSDFVVPGDVAAGLLALTSQLDVTLRDLMVAAFQLVLARRSGQEDIVVATRAPERDYPVLLRSRVRDSVEFRDL
ncbi:MAG: condensation domain-containing protein, partial [Pseudonocardiaceae bacterium]